jgi:hypothetical protein
MAYDLFLITHRAPTLVQFSLATDDKLVRANSSARSTRGRGEAWHCKPIALRKLQEASLGSSELAASKTPLIFGRRSPLVSSATYELTGINGKFSGETLIGEYLKKLFDPVEIASVNVDAHRDGK